MINLVQDLFKFTDLSCDTNKTTKQQRLISEKTDELSNMVNIAILSANKTPSLLEVDDYIQRAQGILSEKASSVASQIRKLIAARIFQFSREEIQTFESRYLQNKINYNLRSPKALILPQEVLADLDIKDPPTGALPLIKQLLQKDPDIAKSLDDRTEKGRELIHIVFKACELLGFAEFQKEHLEPFNKRFPRFPLSEAPRTIRYLNFDDLRELPITAKKAERFYRLEEISCIQSGCCVVPFINHLPSTLKESIKKISISYHHVDEVDPSRFPNLEKLTTMDSSGTFEDHIFTPKGSKNMVKHLALLDEYEQD